MNSIRERLGSKSQPPPGALTRGDTPKSSLSPWYTQLLAALQQHSIARTLSLTPGSPPRQPRGRVPESRREMMKGRGCGSSACTATSDGKSPPFFSFFIFFSSPPFSSSRPVACRVEKIVFITCQGLAELSYVEQDSIKLSYTSMKLQNRSELNNKIISFLREAIPFFSRDTSTAKL